MSAAPPLPDREPLVVLDAEADVAALAPAPADPESALSSTAQAWLRANGLTDTATWSTFRLGMVDTPTCARFGYGDPSHNQPGHGITMPTWDPRDPARVAGLIRLRLGRSGHHFLSPPAGIAGADPGGLQRLVLTAMPYCAMRLHQLRVPGVLLVQDPAVLPPLLPWIGDRELVLAVHRRPDAEALLAVLGPAGSRARVIVLPGGVDKLGQAAHALGGVARPPAPRVELTLPLLRDLHALGERQLASPAGMAALHAGDLADPDLVRAYRIGYLPSDFAAALPPAARLACRGLPLGNALVLPACDASGIIVDLAILPQRARAAVVPSCFAEPRGLVGAAVAALRPHITITTTAVWIGRLWRQGVPPLLLRGVANAQAEAGRIAAAGVRRVDLRVHGAALAGIQDALIAADIAIAPGVAGMSLRLPLAGPAAEAVPAMPRSALLAAAVGPPAAAAAVAMAPVAAMSTTPVPAAPTPIPGVPPAALELLAHDVAAEQAVIRAGAVTYRVQVPWSDTTMVDVMAEAGVKRQRDRLDVAVAAQRLRFAAVAGSRLGVAPAVIAQDLQRLLPLLQGLAAPAAAPMRAAGDGLQAGSASRTAALTRLRDPDLLSGIAADLATLGCPGDADACARLALVAISRLGTDPLWVALTAADPGERFPALDVLAAITPPEDLIHVSRLSEQALANAEPGALRHRLLLLDDAAAITPAVATALRILHARGSLSVARLERDPVRGQWRTRFVAAEGPLALITATTGDVPEALRAEIVPIPAVPAVHTHQPTRPCVAPFRQGAAAATAITRLHDLQRCVEPGAVLLPAEGVALPGGMAGMRALRAACDGLIAASALLHQHQRLRCDGQVVATAADVAIATRVVQPLVQAVRDGLSPRAAQLAAALLPVGHAEFDMQTVAAVTPGWSRPTRQRALDDLLVAEEVVALRGRAGQRRSYRRLTTQRHLDPGQPAHLLTPAHDSWAGATPHAASG